MTLWVPKRVCSILEKELDGGADDVVILDNETALFNKLNLVKKIGT